MDATGTIASTYTPEQLVANFGYEEGIAQFYNMFGGTPILDNEVKSLTGSPAHTVFGQVFEGMEIVDAIAYVATDANDKPVEDVVINRIYLDTYKAAPAASGTDAVSVADAA